MHVGAVVQNTYFFNNLSDITSSLLINYTEYLKLSWFESYKRMVGSKFKRRSLDKTHEISVNQSWFFLTF